MHRSMELFLYNSNGFMSVIPLCVVNLLCIIYTIHLTYMDVSIIIVNYNTSSLLYGCLKSVYEHTAGVSYEVIVVDNKSNDGSTQMVARDFPQVHLIINEQNIGFGAANNRGLDCALGKYIFYLNSDTVLLNNAVKMFFDYFEKHRGERLGAIGCNLTGRNAQIIHSSGTFPFFALSLRQVVLLDGELFFLSLLSLFRVRAEIFTKKMSAKNRCQPVYGKVDYVTGADLFLKNDNYARFDERYFLYFEDSTMQFAMKRACLSRMIIDGPQIEHLCGSSAGTDYSLMRKVSYSRIQFEFSRVRFLGDRYGRRSIFVLVVKLLIVAAWCNPLLLKKTHAYILELLSL